MNIIIAALLVLCLASCGSKVRSMEAAAETPSPSTYSDNQKEGSGFDADSAYSYVERQVSFGPRVPNTEAHREAGKWITSELKRHGAEVIVQEAVITAFDGTPLNAKNIFGRFNADKPDRLLLLAHWDSRPWADQDPDPANRMKPIDGANDGASGVGVLLEIARQLSIKPDTKGVDILFVDAEDWGTEGDDDSWALGTKYFVENPPEPDYMPSEAILLDMVGGEGAVFCREYFSERSNPDLAANLWLIAAREGYSEMFQNRLGTAVMDDHVELIKAGIPAVDIIEFHPDSDSGFNPRWHTLADNMEGISKETLGAVGKTVLSYIRER